MNSRVVAAIARKDIVDAIRNRYLLAALLTPLFVAVLLRVLVPGVNGRSLLTIVVHDPGNSRLLSALRAIPQIGVIESNSAEATAGEVEKREATGGLIVPVNFDADVEAGAQPELKIYLNNKKNTFELAGFRRVLDQLILSLSKHPPPARLVWIDLAKEPLKASRGLDLSQMLLPLLLILSFSMTGAMVVPLLLVEEREKRTLDFLLTSPASLSDIIAGKALTGVAYSVLIAGILLATNQKFVSNWPMTLLASLLGLLLVVGVGIVMGSFLQNTMQLNTWAGMAILLLIAPSLPTPGLPKILDIAISLVPTYHLAEALKDSLAGTTSLRTWGQLAVVSACTLIAFFVAILGLRRQQS